MIQYVGKVYFEIVNQQFGKEFLEDTLTVSIVMVMMEASTREDHAGAPPERCKKEEKVHDRVHICGD